MLLQFLYLHLHILHFLFQLLVLVDHIGNVLFFRLRVSVNDIKFLQFDLDILIILSYLREQVLILLEPLLRVLQEVLPPLDTVPQLLLLLRKLPELFFFLVLLLHSDLLANEELRLEHG